MGTGSSSRKKHPPERPKQVRFTRYQRFVAALQNRRQLYFSAAVAIILLIGTVSINLVYITQTQMVETVPQALLSAITFLTLNNISVTAKDPLGSFLIIFNILFTVIFAQSLLETARVLFLPLPDKDRQAGIVATMRRHIIICGLGRVGFRVASRLVEAGQPVVVIEQNWSAKFVSRALLMGIPIITGDARESETLERAGVRRAEGILAIIDGDLVNLETILTARRLNPQIAVVLRAFNEAFDTGVESMFGQHTAFSVSALAAPTFTAATIARDLAHLLVVGPGGQDFLGVMGIPLSQKSPALAALAAQDAAGELRIVARIPQPEGMILGIVGTLPVLEKVRLQMQPKGTARETLLPSSTHDTIIICGLGKVGYRIVTRLLQMQTGARISVIQRPQERESGFTQAVSELPGVEIFYGDARDGATLRAAGLKRALSIAAVTSEDELNVRVALEARRLHPGVHIVLRVFSEDLADQMKELFAINTAYSVSNLASPTLSAAALLPGIQQGFMVDRHSMALLSGRLPASATGASVSVEEFERLDAITIVAIHRENGMILIPHREQILLPGDQIMMVGTIDALNACKKRHASKVTFPHEGVTEGSIPSSV